MHLTFIVVDFAIEFKMCSVPRINTNKTKTLTSLVILFFNKQEQYFFRRTDDSII